MSTYKTKAEWSKALDKATGDACRTVGPSVAYPGLWMYRPGFDMPRQYGTSREGASLDAAALARHLFEQENPEPPEPKHLAAPWRRVPSGAYRAMVSSGASAHIIIGSYANPDAADEVASRVAAILNEYADQEEEER